MEECIEYVSEERLTDENSVRISRRSAELMLKRMRDLLDKSTYASGTPEYEVVVEFGWQLVDLIGTALNQAA